MKIVYKLNRNSAQFSYVYNIYKLLNGPIYCNEFKKLYKNYPNNIPKQKLSNQ